MNKFEKLIEYIINDEDDKARALFHTIVVEKSRDIYESIMDEEQMGENVHGDEVGDMVDEIGAEESMHEEDGDDEFSMDGDHDDDGETDGDFPADDDAGEEHIDAEMHSEHGEIEDQVMNIDSKLDELLAKFDEIMGGDAHGMDEPDMGGDEPGMGEPGMDHEMSAEPDMEGMMEAENPFAKSGKSGSSESGKSGKSGSAKMEAAKAGSAVSGKSGSAASGKSGSAKMEAAKAGSAVSGKSGTSGKSGSGKMESRKSASELMREYVEKIEDINLTPSTYSEGEPVGAGTGTKKVAVNDKSISLDKGPDFGGTTENILNGKGNNESPDGKVIPAPKSPYETSKPAEHPIAKKNVNVPGGTAGKTSFKHKEGSYETKGDGQGSETGKKVGSAKDGSVSINKKSELSNPGQPNGQKK